MPIRLTRTIFFAVIFTVLFSVPAYIDAQSSAISLECGDIVEGETTPNEQILDYAINVRAGVTLNGRVEPIGSTFNVFVSFHDANGKQFMYFNENPAGVAEVFQNFAVGSSNPILRVTGAHPEGTGSSTYPDYVGAFTIYLGCVLRDGTVINPGDNVDESLGAPNDPPSAPVFTGFGLPIVGPVDFSQGIEIPLQLRQPQNPPIGSDVALYSYDAIAESTATLTVSRISGNISIGVAVIKRDTNEIIFLGGMPSSNNLSVELTFPSDGTYAIGLFRLDTPTLSGTSGAVQIVIE